MTDIENGNEILSDKNATPNDKIKLKNIDQLLDEILTDTLSKSDTDKSNKSEYLDLVVKKIE